MFWTEDKVITYPNMTILEDVLTRDGLPNDKSFTPYTGMRYLISEQFKNNSLNLAATAKNIVDYFGDFRPSKAKANDDSADREYSTNEVTDYYINLEDITEDYIKKFALEAIIGYKLNTGGMKKHVKKSETYDKIYDAEKGDYISPVDLLDNKPDFTDEELLDAEAKLPYLLKQLHEGSILYGGSLLSFIIAAERTFAKLSPGQHIKPSFIVDQGVYAVDFTGRINYQFKIEDNTGTKFRRLYAWINGEEPNSVYYKAYKELLVVCKILGIDIKQENAKDYTPEVIEKALCTYLASNEEYLETYGFVNKDILGLLKPDMLFSLIKRVNAITDGDTSEVTIESTVEELELLINRLTVTKPREWCAKPKLVRKFLEIYNEFVEECDVDLKHYDSGRYLLSSYKTGLFAVDAAKISNRNVIALVSITGHLICLESNILGVRAVTLEEAIAAYKGGTKIGWRPFTV